MDVRSKVIEYFEKNNYRYQEDYQPKAVSGIEGCLACYYDGELLGELTDYLGAYLETEGDLEVGDEFLECSAEETAEGIVYFFPHM